MPTQIHLPGVPHVFTSTAHLVLFLHSSPGYVGKQRAYLEAAHPDALRLAGYAPQRITLTPRVAKVAPYQPPPVSPRGRTSAAGARAAATAAALNKITPTAKPLSPQERAHPPKPVRPGDVPFAPLEPAIHLAAQLAPGPRQQEGLVGVHSIASAIRGEPYSGLGLGLEAAGLLPFSPLRGLAAARAGLTAVRGARDITAAADAARVAYRTSTPIRTVARRTLRAGQRAQQLPGGARSPITRHLIERPADAISQRLPNAPIVGARARVAKAAGREQKIETGRERQAAEFHIQALPKQGSDADIAHFWWAQLPASHRNAEGLKLVRDAQVGELRKLVSPGRLAELQNRRAKIRLTGLPEQARTLAASIDRLNGIIANPPRMSSRAVDAVHALSGDRAAVLQKAGLLNPERATARRGLVSNWLGLKPTGEEAFIGHRLDKVRGAFGIRSKGVGKARYPQGVGKENKLVLAKTGQLRQSTHVAAQDWAASHTYRESVRARKALWEMGDPFKGYLPDRHMLVNPEGQTVPPSWKTDMLARLAADGNPEKLRQHTEQALQGFLGDKHNWEDVLAAAKKQGVASKLRVVPEPVVDRYYSQFLPVGRATKGGKVYDKLIDATSASLIFGRVGYVPKNVAQNLVMAAPHQGPLLLVNAPRAAQLIPHPGQSGTDRHLWRLLASEIGGGASASVGQDITTRGLGAAAKVVTAVADTPLRISAFLHEAAAEKVIPRLSPHLSEKDKQALLGLLTSPEKRPLLNDIRQRSVDAMGDFDRMTPQQRRWARRFLIVPGWLMAGTRYPLHFAAHHPIRTAALAYAAAGEPGAPKRLQVNKPIDEYLAKGLPSFVKGVDVGGGKVFRTQSLFPASLPADIAFTAKGDPLTAASYANPLPESAWLTARSQYQTLSGETKKTSFLDALNRNFAGRLAPGAQFLREEISPPSGQGKLYPDTSRLGRLARETGVVPVKINRQAAARMRYSERGMTQSVQATTDQQNFLKKLDAAGYEPDQKLKDAYKVRIGRAERLDAIHAHGLSYQQKAYQSDVRYAVELGQVSKRQAAQMLQSMGGATEVEIRHARDEMRDAYFGGREIRQAKAELQTATAP